MKLKTKIKQILAKNPSIKTTDLIKEAKISKSYGYTLARLCRKELGIVNGRLKTRMQRSEPRESWETEYVTADGQAILVGGPSEEELNAAKDIIRTHHTDNVNHPAHYKVGGIETIDFIEAKKLNYNLGNVVKYITRAEHKGNTAEDLLKARWYLNREIAKLAK